MSSNPELLAKERLKSDLKRQGVALSHHESKEQLVQLYRKHITRGKGRGGGGGGDLRSEFSSDDEFAKQHSKQQSRKQATPTRRPIKVKVDTYLADVVALSDEELLEELQAHGKATGPIVDSTRSAYQRMLAKLIAEQTVSKSASRETQQEEEEEEEEDEGVDANVSYIGEWSSDEEAEEIEVQPPPPRRMETRQSSKIQVHVSRSHRSVPSKESHKSDVRERVIHRESHKPISVGEGRPTGRPQEHAKPPRPPPPSSSSSSGSFLLSFCLLVVMILVVFLAYDYYTMGDTSLAATAIAFLKQQLLKTTAPAADEPSQ